LFRFKHKLLKISVNLQTALAAETRLAEGQWLELQLNMEELRMFRLGTRMPHVSRRTGKHFEPLKTFITSKISE
jgi:hypothetical protein